MSTSAADALSAPRERRRLNTRALAAAAAALAVPAAAAALPDVAQATQYNLRYWGPGCMKPGRANGSTGPYRTPIWMFASTFGYTGCGATNDANVGAYLASTGGMLTSATNPNGYVATQIEMIPHWTGRAGCWNNGLHSHWFSCWSTRSV